MKSLKITFRGALGRKHRFDREAIQQYIFITLPGNTYSSKGIFNGITLFVWIIG